MPSPQPPRVPAPRELADLPFAPHLRRFAGGGLGVEASFDTVHIDGASFEDERADGVGFLEAALSAVSFESVRLRRARFNDVWLQGVRMVGCDLAESGWLDVEAIGGVLAGLEFHSASLRRVVFHGCKFDSVNLRGAKLHEVVFHDCVLREVDLSGAALTGCSFPGSRLERIHLHEAKLVEVDLREAAGLDPADGVDALRGAVVTPLQVLELAPALAEALGLIVREPGESLTARRGSRSRR
ncbi:pentapeptide repeat-containing protein [Streptacidiphilus rugosus]|uniref:pentapeptide repeat-containing protein n=1 Tax=Streptacidiphilus rugosus TaxID=405783 RepID=UPI0005645854|nr:pentapeptide repeat-containing protein [Streptacidiphilus rugosus]